MNVKKIFITLVTIVACVILGALVLNVLMPNVVTSVCNAAESMLYKATGMSFDFNADGNPGGSTFVQGNANDNGQNTGNAGVEGYK